MEGKKERVGKGGQNIESTVTVTQKEEGRGEDRERRNGDHFVGEKKAHCCICSNTAATVGFFFCPSVFVRFLAYLARKCIASVAETHFFSPSLIRNGAKFFLEREWK